MCIKLNLKEKALVNCKTGELIRPSCFDSLAPLYSYLVEKRREKEAEDLLKRVFKGEKVITKMIERSQKHKS